MSASSSASANASTIDSARANELLDTLHLELLDRIEQQVRCQLQLEDAVCRGQLLVAKTRYTLGKNSVSSAQLPTENSADFEALASISRPTTDAGTRLLDGDFSLDRAAVSKADGRPDPLRWFGVLLPQSLQSAQLMFQRAVELSVEGANIGQSLQNVMRSILGLRTLLATEAIE